MNVFGLIPPVLRVASPGDILVPTLGNISVLYPPKVVGAQDIKLPALVNLSSLDVDGHARIYVHAGIVADIALPALTNSSTIVAPTVQAAPADGFIRLPALTNASSFVTHPVVVSAAPADGYIRLPALANTSTLVAPIVSVDDTGGFSDDSDEMVAGGSIGGGVV